MLLVGDFLSFISYLKGLNKKWLWSAFRVNSLHIIPFSKPRIHSYFLSSISQSEPIEFYTHFLSYFYCVSLRLALLAILARSLFFFLLLHGQLGQRHLRAINVIFLDLLLRLGEFRVQYRGVDLAIDTSLLRLKWYLVFCHLVIFLACYIL